MARHAAPVLCKNCNAELHGKYCSNCGEKVYTSHDKRVLHFLEEGFHFITHFEGTLFATLKSFAHPGKYSTDYCEGIRKKYFKPLSFFLLIVVIYLIFPFFQGLNQKLHYYTTNRLFGTLASAKINEVQQKTGLSFEELSVIFHEKGAKVSKFLLFVLIPLTALVIWPFTYRRKPLFFDQLIFATEINIIYVLFGFLILPMIMILIAFLLWAIYPTATLDFSDNITSLVIALVMGIYLTLGAKRFFGFNYLKAISLTLFFLVMFSLFINPAYKFLLFNIAIRLVH